MESNALPSTPDYVYPTLVALKEKGGSATIDEIEDAVAEIDEIERRRAGNPTWRYRPKRISV